MLKKLSEKNKLHQKFNKSILKRKIYMNLLMISIKLRLKRIKRMNKTLINEKKRKNEIEKKFIYFFYFIFYTFI